MITLHLLGSARLILENGKEVKLGSSANLLGYLAMHDGEWVDRRRCAIDLYPDDEYEVSGNRLRVALVRLKKQLGDALQVDRDQLKLNLDLIDVDAIAIQKALQESGDEIDERDELQRLSGLLPKFKEDLLSEGSGLWLLSWQESWRKLCLDQLMRLYDLYSDNKQWTLGTEASSAALTHDPSSISIWQKYLRSLYELDRIDQGIREIGLAKEASDISKEEAAGLFDFCNSLAVPGPDVANRWTEDELIVLGRMFARGIEDSPEDAAAFFTSRGAEGEFNRDRMAYLKFLLQLTESGQLSKSQEIDTRIRVLEAVHGKENDWKIVLEQTEILMKMDMNLIQRARVGFVRSFAQFQGRDFEGAIATIQDAVITSEKSGDFLRAVNCRVSEGSFRWHIGEFEKALELYMLGITELGQSDRPLVRSNLSVIWSNTTAVYVILADWENAYNATQKAFEALEREPNENMRPMFHALVGIVSCQRGDWSKGVDYISDGLRRAYRRGASRDQQISMEWAIGALSFAGMQKDVVALLDWVNSWRHKTGHTRSVAEQKYVDRLIGRYQLKPGERIDPNESAKKVMSYLISRLREAEAQSRNSA
ncbi:MAG: hypothetical protein KF824_12755 [Fimbriimonadaceae bacterium]|nr:MAG: hypothetical protein KF824_12755 [Fimbriimonadaceae bacterium]